MPASNVQATYSNLRSSREKMPAGFKTKVTPRHPKLVKREANVSKLIPSVYAREMSLTTEERLSNTFEMRPPRILELLDMSETTHHKFSSLDLDQAMFQPYPSEIVFQNYLPFQTYKVPLELRNGDKVPRLVKVIVEDSLYFKVVSPLDVSKKVAPGMASTFTILFTPQENKDYIHSVICVTEREKFEVPIRAIGPRAILDFPDSLHFLVCPVKCLSQRTLLVRNIGNCEAKFKLSTCRPFSVEPSVGTLIAGQCMQVTVGFMPKTTGDHSQVLLLHYHSGEDIEISLYGESTDINIGLDRNSVVMEKTYISLASSQKVAIINKSDSIVHYQWKTFATEGEEERDKLRLSSELNPVEDKEMEQFLTENTAASLQARLSLFSHTLQKGLMQTQQQLLSLDDQDIIMRPPEGEIWPNSTAEVNIIFKPQEARIYQQTVYCEISGRESRLPLCIQGEGLGPKLRFNFDFLDMGNIVIGSQQSYKLFLSNKGLINGTYKLMQPSTVLGLCFSFKPSEGMIPPGACQTMEVHFSSDKLGVFTEELLFSVAGNPKPVTVTFRGCLIGPTFHFSVPELNFGEVSFGFPQMLTCCLSNTSVVPMSFGLRIPGDGMGQASITSREQVAQPNRSEWGMGDQTERPKEFILSPSTGTVRAMAEIDIQLTFCSNTVQDYNLALVLDVQGVGEEVLAIPIKARCVVPDVVLKNPVLKFQNCFLGHPYEQSVELVNETDLPACYGLLPQQYEEDPAVLYSSPHARGIIQPYSTELIPVVFQAKKVDNLEQTAYIAVLGRKDPPLELLLSCVGQGPSVSVSAAKLNFGYIPVLTDVTRTLQLSNESPIAARFCAQMLRNKSHWRVEPSEGEIPPEQSLELKLIVNLNDTVPFQDELLLEIQDSQIFNIPLAAKGKGTTIVTDRPFAPSLNLGTHFSSGPCQYAFRITNRGRRTHQLLWTTEGFPQFPNRDHLSPNKPRNKKSKSLQTSPQEGPVFSLSPARLLLPPGHSADMLLEGSSDVPRVVTEKLVCYAVIGRQYVRECIITADVTCQFVSPAVEISSQQLNFYVEKAPDASLVPLYERLILKSLSSLNLSMELLVHEPFGLCDYDGDDLSTTSKSLVLAVGAQQELWVRFNPMYQQDCHSRVVEEVLEFCYHGHPQQDRVLLKGEVQFPNLKFSSTTLDFGCILNNTKSRRKLTMTNCSPLCVSYRWAFLVDQQQCHIGFFDETSRGIDGDAGGKRKESGEAQWELLEQKEADGKTDTNRETDVIIPQLEEEELHHGSSNGNEQNRTCLTRRSKELGSKPINLTANGHPSVGVKEVFDISSLYGVLEPGDSKLVTFSFLGHADISTQVLALCDVEGGPTYEITLKGQASFVSYTLDTNDIDFGLQLFDHVAEAEVTLKNTGKVRFDFSTLNSEQGPFVEEILPGQPLVIPNKGHLEPYAEIKLSVYYLPGIPEVFHKTFQLQVAFYETESITVRGEGVFPRLCLDLPRDLNEEIYGSLLKEAKDTIENEKSSEALLKDEMPPEDDYIPTYDALLQMELERLIVKENATAVQKQHQATDLRGSGSSSNWLKKLCKLSLPEYTLDFGFVINGNIVTHIVKITNTCPLAVSFKANRSSLAGTGFSTELDRVQGLPFCETETFEVKFDTRGANLGKINAVMPIQVMKGPQVQVRLCAEVTMPSLTVSTDTLQFHTIQCGLCEVITIQLHNDGPVPCEWTIRPEERPKKIDKHIPLYLRRQAQMKQRPPPVVFELLPSDGTLYPGDRTNVQVKFSPAEGKAYSQRIVITVAQSTQRILLLAQGQGEEPQLEFSSSEINFGSILPYSEGKVAEVIIRNPCPFPTEFYSLDFDKQYLKEEEILRMLKGYDAQNVLLLPPRVAGEPLPPEVLDYYKEHSSKEPKQESTEGLAEGDKGETDALFEGEIPGVNGLPKGNSSVVTAVGDLEYDPVSTAVARYMGIDLSPEGKAALNRRGIAIIVHGAPLSGKTRTSVTLAKHYGAACLSVDEVVQEALSSGNSSAAWRARELCAKAAVVFAQREEQEATVDITATASQAAGVLSMEAVAKHTAEGSQISDLKVPPSSASTRNKTNITGRSQKNDSSNPAASVTDGQVHRRVSASASQNEELFNCLLPEDVLVEILSERLQLSDCYRGVVIDGLETQYCCSLNNTLQIVLKAFNNRRHIYVLNLFNSYSVFKLREKHKLDQEQEARIQWELENSREEQMTPSEDWDTTPRPEDPVPLSEDVKQELSIESDRHLQVRFHQYEQSQAEIQHILQFWDRTQSRLLQPMVSEVQETVDITDCPPSSAKKTKKEREKEKAEREKLKVDSETKSQTLSQTQVSTDGVEGLEKIVLPEPTPHTWMSLKENKELSAFEIIKSMKLPSHEEILDELGIGPKGPPIPPPIIFSIVHYPKMRPPNTQLSSNYFTFLKPISCEDLSEKEKELGSETVKEGMTITTTSNPGQSEEPKPEYNQGLTDFRWIVPPNGAITLRIKFNSSVHGQFHQTFSFEVLGTKRCYQLHCKGICTYPSISRDPKILFAHCKKTLRPESGLQKTYVIQSDLYEFGPLLCGKTRDRYKEGKYPENMEKFVIHNNSQMDAEIQFCFQHDSKATTFLLDPPNMTLKTNERKVLNVWAYPNNPKHIEDSVVCCIKGNPEPVLFRLSCIGVRPELEMDRKLLHFDKTPPFRKETQSLRLFNNTLMPAAWRLRGLELLGDEFSVSQNQGIIMPHSDFLLHMHFIAKSPIKLKRSICLEVSDVENILGIVQHSENIQIIAEAYDIAVDIIIPEDLDGSLDFGTFKVSEEVKRSIKLENKGKYDIAFKFTLDATEPGMPDLNSIFSITPRKGSLRPNNKPTTVQIIYQNDKEMSIRDSPILCCQVIEPNLEGGETISTIPIKVSVQAVFSKYIISPSNDINFGPMVHGSRKKQTLTVENKGNFEMRFTIRLCKNASVPAQRRGVVNKKPSKDSYGAKPSSASELRLNVQTEAGLSTQVNLTCGVFTLFPCFGILAPGAQQVVNVDCKADSVGSWEECLAIDITDRDPSDNPDGIPYKLVAEVCVPGIASTDIASIFEEHRICKNSSMLQCEQYRDSMGIYVQDENKFVFNNVLVGQSAKARFRLINPGKVSCELTLAIKTVKTQNVEVFELTPTKMCIPSHSHAFATVTFSPLSMQMYHMVFEAVLKSNTSQVSAHRPKALVFDLMGEGNLPCITVLKPVQRTNQGHPVLQFKRSLVGRGQTLPLVIKNNSNVPAQVSLILQYLPDVFTLKAAPGTVCRLASSHIESDPGKDAQLAYVASLTLMAGQQAEFLVGFHPKVAQKFEASMKLMVKDNQYDQTVVQIVGEGYHDIIILENVGNRVQQESTESLSDHLDFGDCHVGCTYQETFTMTNPNSSKVLRFEWLPNSPQLSFAPQVGHLHAECSKVVTVTFCSEEPLMLNTQTIKCALSSITFQQPVDQVPDWDDSHRTVKWVDVDKSSQQPTKRKKVVTDPEPPHTVVENSSREIELIVSATCDYVQFQCDNRPIHFKDTMLYQTRVFQLQMENKGTVKLEYSWQILMETYGKITSFEHGGRTSRSAQGSRTPERPASSLQSVSSLLVGDPELPPFSVEPAVGCISPGTCQTFQIRFSPLEVAEFEASLICRIPNLKDNQSPEFTVHGRCLLPYCHFHLKDSDYLTGNRRNPEPHSTLMVDPNTRVIEFTSVGIGTSVCREFGIINPTNKPYSFTWRCEDSKSPFSCLTPSKSIQPGKEVKVSFEYQVLNLDIAESFWTFFIPEHSLSLPFLLVGIANEPVVFIDRAHLNLGSLLLGCETHRTVFVVNREDQPFHFTVQKSSCHSEGYQDKLVLDPMEGTIPANDRIPLVIWITPTREGDVAFNLVVTVQRKLQPLTMNVKGECYSMNAYVRYESPERSITELSSNQVHPVDFKQLELNNKSTCTFVVSNPGKFSLDVEYDLSGPAALQLHLQVEPKSDTVAVGGQSSLTLTFCPQRKCVLKDLTLSIKIKNGPIFCCALMGSAVAPDLEFSSLKHNFGLQFTYCSGMVPATHTLVISNRSSSAISLDCLFSNTTVLEVNFTPLVLSPGGSVEVLLSFYPRKAVRYHEKVVFEMNKCAKRVVEILGQGAEMKIDLEDPAHRVVNFGALQIGQQSRKLVSLVNNSHCSLTFCLHRHSDNSLHHSKILSVRPDGQVTLKEGGGRCAVELLFSPQQRMPPFTEELQLECLGAVRPLLVMKGCCQAVEVRLDIDYLQFGAVVQRCQATRRIIMHNSGDIGARFKWDVKSFAPDFTISPAEGYITPGMEVSLEVTFAPTELRQDLRYDDLCCSVEGGKSLKLTLTGSCIVPPVAPEVVNFACQVRSQCTQSLALPIRINQQWTLKCVIEGEHWSGPPTLLTEPTQQNTYEITYKPLVMTTDGEKHEGSVFFSFPDGSGILYILQGTAEPPKAEGTITEEIKCKTLHTQTVTVHNWLPRPQRFRAVRELIKPDRSDDTVSLEGLEYVDVPAQDAKSYKLSFFTYKEGLYSFKVTFKNETTGEYLFYNLNFKAVAPGVIRTIEMATRVRQITSASVEVENPLPVDVSFTAECQNTDVYVPPQFLVPAHSVVSLTFEYQPLCEGESTARLVLYAAELGHFFYDLKMKALSAPNEKPLYFTAPLGSKHSGIAKFTNFSRVKTEYICKTDSPSFTVEKSIKAAAGNQTGTEISMAVHFEPCLVGDIQSRLTISSDSGGEFVFPLYGTCTPPKAQGPLSISLGSSVSIAFKNVFQQTTTFSYQVDNPAFTVKGAETISAQKTQHIQVIFDGPPTGSKGPYRGKLTITCPRMEGHGQCIFWVYYLKGVCPEPTSEKRTP
ncbi:hydrocephalus-inducing protein homolog isoform X1 [Danio rerio]|uniref:Hydrocephalus-inducing protein homolog isoform X1 n=2 Tax=Danio rerio TaxID=7955 RepID=A0AC58HTI8_DANRE|nr:hydrocephalus-inducing protein homolog isoform X1 [Danio rerio]|eukprot:XP_017207419.1 hydrocephalus-inducing protein homolog isoform X1 [Danio rerio]